MDVLHIDGSKRLQVFQNLISSEPYDASIIIQFRSDRSRVDENSDTELKHKLLQELFDEKILYIV